MGPYRALALMTTDTRQAPGESTDPESEGSLLLEARGVRKRYGAVLALGDVSFTLRRGEIHGLCGHNGAGKSTLVKILTGIVQPDAGVITIDGERVAFRTPLQAQEHGIALVDQELSLAPDLSVEENIFLGSLDAPLLRHPRRYNERARALLARVGLPDLDPRTLVEHVSIGERQLVEIARMLGRNANVLILDEPTATLSEAEIERVFAVVREVVRDGRSAIYISHRLDEVLELCDRVTVFRDGEAVASRSSADIAHRDELIRMMIGVELPPPTDTDAADVAAARSVRIAGLEVPPVVSSFDLSFHGGQIVGLTGQVGAGTSEVLRALAGLVPDARGGVVIDDRLVDLGSPTTAVAAGIAFASNDRKGEGLFLGQTVQSNLVATRLPHLSWLGVLRTRLAGRVAGRLASFVHVDGARLRESVDTLSGGNQQKVFLGRCLDRQDVRLLLLDEPTRGVDVAGRAEIHRIIREAALAGVAVIFASTELDEILELSDIVVTMFGGTIIATRPRSEVTSELLSADMTLSERRERAVEPGTMTVSGEGATG
jgi:ABC-type sugar transport system ATPase subunit